MESEDFRKKLKVRTPREAVCKELESELEIFIINHKSYRYANIEEGKRKESKKE